jgi:hypothetical protein
VLAEFFSKQLADRPLKADVLIGLRIVIIYRLARSRTPLHLASHTDHLFNDNIIRYHLELLC